MEAGLLDGGEDTSGLDDDLGAVSSPRDLGGVLSVERRFSQFNEQSEGGETNWM